MQQAVAGAVLAGGASRRMGRDKRFMPIQGSPLLFRVLSALELCTHSQMIIANDAHHPMFATIQLPIIRDDIPDKGSLGGLYTAITHGPTEWIVCVAADMPLLNAELILMMIQKIDNPYDVILPVVDGHPQGFHAIYRKTSRSVIYQQMEKNNLRVQDIFSHLRVCEIDEDTSRQYDTHLKSFVNLNSPEDIQSLVG